ncbi:SCO6880 family protein [Rhodococcus opacus]|uniref:PrgI family protein n=1 Tax=Rhodococcus opacus TaxID=37919 RepID=A0AAX3YRH2_RHOOP|nr:SCO6880 family protein [Rhodococcus opacus]MDX5962243.1 SCO6880 family protein [Rhodococcus opacus]NKY74860.1 hypothetical protein [Rhodococcus opacus]UNN05350.1 hypothetical protein MOO23_40785 [Rhodococcus opacus]WLF51513.1 hypothetical protein Q5707_39200 [Rhodococcus opacus]
MSATRTNSEPQVYLGGRAPRNEGVMGLSGPVTWFILGTLIISLLVLMRWGLKVGAITGGVLLLAVVPMVLKRHGLTGYERSLLAMQFFGALRRKENIYRGGLFSEMPGGKSQLPGVLAPTKMYEGEDSAGYRFGMIHMPKTNQYTIVMRAWPQGDEAVDRGLVNQWVGEWGIVLASAGLTSDIEGIVPVLDTVPETGNALLTQARAITRVDAPALAKAVVFEGATEFHRDEVQLAARVAITFAATTDERKKDPGAQAVEIGRRLPGIRAAIEASGVAVRPMTAAEITGVVRRSFDPASQLTIERAEATGDDHGITWDNAGPISHENKWEEYWHDGGRSVTWLMSAGPKSAVDESTLRRLIAPHPDLPRKRVAIVYRPHRAADAVKIIDDDYRNAIVAAQNRNRGISSAAAQIDVELAERSRDELARGHGATRIGLLITVTEPIEADMPRIDALVNDLAVQCQLNIRRCYRFQDAAFAASLGIGVLLPDHASMPSALTA